ncbi:MAG: hypothetical protein NT116_02380, partial [Candidatus Parcubacteria bacterium]|nr:hypothetical protein [Candidatus Parcubacteria bacterium]
MSNYDFNIQNYNPSQLEEIFGLTKNYDIQMIETKLSDFNQRLMNSAATPLLRKSIIEFAQSAKNILINQLQILEGFKKISDIDIYNLDKKLKSSFGAEEGNTFIIEKPPTPYANSLPSEYYPGVFNPLTKRILHQNVSIDTRFRENYYATQSTNFQFDLPIKFTKVVSMQLDAFEFPSSFFSISKKSGNNFFWVSADEEKALIFVPDGNYTPLGLVNYLNNFVGINFIVDDYPILTNLIFSLNIDTNI